MFWSCEECNGWVTAYTEVDLAVARQQHLNSHREAPTEELVAPEEDTALDAKYIAWGIALILGLLSRKWEALTVVVPFVALIAWVLTHREGGK